MELHTQWKCTIVETIYENLRRKNNKQLGANFFDHTMVFRLLVYSKEVNFDWYKALNDEIIMWN